MPSLARRLAARLIDCCLLGLILAAVWGLGFHAATNDCNGVSRCYGWSAFGITLLLVPVGGIAILLYDIVALAFWGTTIGKSALGLRVARLDGTLPGAGQSQIRAITFWAPVGVFAVVALYLLATGAAWASVLVVLIVAAVAAARVFLSRTFFHDWIAQTGVVTYEPVAPPRGGISAATRRAGATVLAATAVATIALVWAWIGAHPHELSAHEQQAYIQENQHLLDSLPQLAGSARLDLQSNPYCPNGATVGVATTAQYRTPPKMRNQDVVDFYVRSVGDDWQHEVFNARFPIGSGPGSPSRATSIDVPGARFKRGSASISVSTAYPSSAYTVVVDSHSTGHSCHED